MDFLSLVKARHSVRAYRQDSIEKDKLDYVLECGRMAPSAVNYQPWLLKVAVSDAAKDAVRSAYRREWFETAPCYIVVCVDTAQAWTRKADGKSHADVDAAIIAEHICLAAAEVGLGTCWVCNFDPAVLRGALRLAPGVEPVAVIAMGYADDTPVKSTTRKPLNEIAEMI